ncbi:Cell division protein DivIC (FtsB), stabilizes FtsL against RasP cleavage [Arcticibacter svalbardensis MN12-7]|uniref:Cell division protein DivIC (FtsB), stabilizes FtsL against RasP cleavage n=1 Tax=Arcticibacter svalbardensis MN12-7 TaxID=1150600 RepID=R9H0C9_9SPHI|nr:septum formation initiator family protein [Arcticibacter svalbardensis]EOR94654.1 Cell division protein DivIC (FtsB), stabilizes FtsL against RasP cleavage [Arcticibacter svalbardensis MN12-7]
MKQILHLFSNKYFLSAMVFAGWMLFFDRNDLISQYDYRTELTKLQEEKDFYTFEIERVKKTLDELTTNQAMLEKFAREKYLMKKENEDVYVIIPESPKEK